MRRDRVGWISAADVWSNGRIDWKGIINGSGQMKTAEGRMEYFLPCVFGREGETLFVAKIGEREMKRRCQFHFPPP